MQSCKPVVISLQGYLDRMARTAPIIWSLKKIVGGKYTSLSTWNRRMEWRLTAGLSSLDDLVALYNLAKDDVLAIQPGSGHRAEEEPARHQYLADALCMQYTSHSLTPRRGSTATKRQIITAQAVLHPQHEICVRLDRCADIQTRKLEHERALTGIHWC